MSKLQHQSMVLKVHMNITKKQAPDNILRISARQL